MNLPYTPSEQETFMRHALDEARLALQEGNLPIGAVIVCDGQIVARGRNHLYCDGDQPAHFLRHAETEAIGQLARRFDRRTEPAAIFTTVEPCWMCYGTILVANISHIYFAAPDVHFGAGQIHHIGQYDRTRILTYQGGVLEQESFALLYAHSDWHARLLFGPRFEEMINQMPALHDNRTHLVAACGLYCGACYHYRASFPDGQHLLRPEFRGNRPLEGFTCQGCRSDRLYIHPGCADCAIRRCADQKGIAHCGQCAELPCERLLAFQNDGHPHHLPILEQLEDVQRQGAEQWLIDQAARWTCSCGQPFSWYETTCTQCGSPLDGFQHHP